MKKILSISLLAGAILFSGCSGKNDVENDENKNSLEIKASSNGYVFSPLQYASAEIVSGVKDFRTSTEATPIIMKTDNCKILGSSNAGEYTAMITINKVVCTIENQDGEFISTDTMGYVLKDNYIGIDLSKKEVEKRADLKKSEKDNKETLYGLNPGQKIKIFINQGTLQKM